MRYQLLAPVVSYINGDNLAEALKIYVKQNYAQQINNLIVSDNIKRYNAAVKYYNENSKKKIGLTISEDVGYTMYPSNSFIRPLYKQSEYDDGSAPRVVSNLVPVQPVVRVNPYGLNPVVGVNQVVGVNPYGLNQVVGVNPYGLNQVVGVNPYYRR